MMKMTLYSQLISVYCILVLGFMAACSDDGEESSQLKAEAGLDQNTLVGKPVTLDGSASTDSKGIPFDFSWKFILKPDNSDAELTNNTMPKPGFTPDISGKYKIELTVSNTSKAYDTVTIAAFDVIEVPGTYDNLFPGPNVGIRDFVTAFDELYATCEFTEIGGIEAKKIARYNGTAWNPVGCGLEEGSIYDMIFYKGELYVTGQFEEIGCIAANNIARWNGTAWNAVEGGVTGNEAFGNALAIYNDELYVGGRFTNAGNINVSNIAKWNGTSWSAVGQLENGSVRTFQVYKQKLYVGGFFTTVNSMNIRYITAYDGTNWSALGGLQNLELKSTGAVKYMAVFQEHLYISGDFTINNNEVSELITWNGSQFDDFGRAFTRFPGNEIRELAVLNNILYIGGKFKNVVGSQANNIIQWDGEHWGIMSQGISGNVNAIEGFNGKIYIGGDFNTAGGKDADNLSIWTKN